MFVGMTASHSPGSSGSPDASDPVGATAPAAAPARPVRRRGPKARLSQELIIEAAFRISELGGTQALTFQAIGEEVGAHPTALYRHFRDRHELMPPLFDAPHAPALDRV